MKHPNLLLCFDFGHLMPPKAPGTDGDYQCKSGLPQATFCVLRYVSKHWSPPMYLPYLLPLYAEAQEVPSCFAVALKLRCPDTRCALCCLMWHCQALLPTCCTHTHTHSPAKLLIKCDQSTFKCLYWPALTLINVSKKSEVPAHWRWSLASDKWFLMLYHTPLDQLLQLASLWLQGRAGLHPLSLQGPEQLVSFWKPGMKELGQKA